ncbi:MAG: hypothetical protein MZW92_77365 [Comamonadaceae bacterium]|nr:hypothetical protein [Comamonadaceae bacterium]
MMRGRAARSRALPLPVARPLRARRRAIGAAASELPPAPSAVDAAPERPCRPASRQPPPIPTRALNVAGRLLASRIDDRLPRRHEARTSPSADGQGLRSAASTFRTQGVCRFDLKRLPPDRHACPTWR